MKIVLPLASTTEREAETLEEAEILFDEDTGSIWYGDGATLGGIEIGGSSLTDTDDLPEGTTNLYYTSERVDDRVAALLTEGTGIGLTYNDGAGTLTIANTAPDQTVAITAGTGISTSGTYPNFTVNSTITQYTDEMARDALGTALTAGSGITITPNDGSDIITIASSITQYTDENARDAIGAALVAGTNVTITVDDAANTITIDAAGGGGGGSSAWGSITGTLSSQTDLQTALDAKVDETITVNGQALSSNVTLDADDIDDTSTTHKFVTAADLTKLANTSNTNTGDQTSIVGITGTKAQFDTAVTDGNILYVGDVTQYTDEMARDAIGTALTAGTGITVTPNDGADTITIATTITQYTDELAQDAVGNILVDSSRIDFTYNDATPSITADIIADSVSNTYLSNMAQATIKGRASGAGTGDPTDLTPAQATAILDDVVFATDSVDGTKGLLPQPLAADVVTGGGVTFAKSYTSAGATWDPIVVEDIDNSVVGNVGMIRFSAGVGVSLTSSIENNSPTSPDVFELEISGASIEPNIPISDITASTTSIFNSDSGWLIKFNRSSAIAATISFAVAWNTGDYFYVKNVNTGTATITPASGTINGAANIAIASGQSALIIYDSPASDFRVLFNSSSGSGSVADGDYGDITVSSSGATWTVDANAITYAKMQQQAALSVLGNSTNATANMGAITATNDGNVLRRSGTTIGFGAINLGSSAAVTGTTVVSNGGTGRSTLTTAYGLLAAGTTATGNIQTLSAGATTTILVGGGASALPVWTTATGSGAPVRATSPTLVTPLLGTPTSGTLTNCTGLPIIAGTTGTLTEVRGGTNQTTYATGDLLYASGSNTLAKRTIGSTGQVLTVASGVPTWSTISVSTMYESSAQTITAAGSLTLAHGLGGKPQMVTAVLVCSTAEHGYSIGDELVLVGNVVGSNTAAFSAGHSIVPDATNINVRFGAGTAGIIYQTVNKSTGAIENLTTARWTFIVRAWRWV